MSEGALGAYGLRIEGPVDRSVLRAVRPDAPVLALHQRLQRAGETDPAADSRTTLLEGGGWATVDVGPAAGRAEFVLPSVLCEPGELVHPFGTLAASAMVRSQGHNLLHASVVAWDGRAVALLGRRGAGKSTLGALLGLADPDCDLLSDDLCALDGLDVLPGPAAVDLRPGAVPLVEHHGGAGVLARGGTRLRVTYPPQRRSARIAAFVMLGWGDQVRLDRQSGPGSLLMLNEHLDVPEGEGRRRLLDLLDVPVHVLTRPAGLEHLAPVNDGLRELARR